MSRMRALAGTLLLLAVLASPKARAKELTPEARLAAAVRAGDWLVDTLDEDGKFLYLYDPASRRVGESYNLLRHAGTIYALCQLYEATDNARYRESAARAAHFLAGHVEKVEIEGRPWRVLISDPAFTRGNVNEGRVVKTGGCALTVLALMRVDRIHGTDTWRELCDALTRYLLFTQMANGNVRSKYLLEDGHFDTWQSRYYPGETLVALATMAGVSDETALHESMHRLLLYLAVNWQMSIVDVRQLRDFDHWSLLGLEAAWPHLDEAALARMSPAQSPWSRAKLLTAATAYITLEWGFMVAGSRAGKPMDGAVAHGGPTITPASTRMEGVQATWRLLATADAAPDAWRQPMQRRLQFILRGQYSARDAALLKGPVPITGAFRRAIVLDSPSGSEIRIDYLQHAISALLNRP